jgi:hypothetical protein
MELARRRQAEVIIELASTAPSADRLERRSVVIASIYMAWSFEKALAPITEVVLVALSIFAVGLFFGSYFAGHLCLEPSFVRR